MHGTTAARTWLPAAVCAGFVALATALLLAALPAHAATTLPAPGNETRINLTPLPLMAQADTSSATSTNSDDTESGSKRSKRSRAVIRLDSDRDFESFKDVATTAPWMIGAILLVAGSIFLTPIILLVGIVWYKLRKTRMQNEALLMLAEKGVLPAAQAVDAVTSGVMPESVTAGVAAAAAAPTTHQAAMATRRRVVWSDLRRGVLLAAVGLSLTLYSVIHSASANWVGLVLLFVGLGYVILWWFEDRHLAERSPPGGAG